MCYREVQPVRFCEHVVKTFWSNADARDPEVEYSQVHKKHRQAGKVPRHQDRRGIDQEA